MRFAVCAIWHQSNSFSPIPTTLASFEQHHYREGDALLNPDPAGSTVLAGVVGVAREIECTIIPLIDARAPAGAPLDDAAFDALRARLCARLERLRGTIDGVLLDLSGGMLTTSDLDADATLLDAVRAVIGSGVPLVATVGFRANVSPRLLAIPTLLVGPSAAPEPDPAHRGRRALTLLAQIARGEIQPASALRQVPLLMPLAAQDTTAGALAEVTATAARIAAEPGVVQACVFGGFPYADAPQAGSAIVVTTDGEPARADALAAALAAELWRRREHFRVEPANLETAIHAAMAASHHPVVLADTGDDPGAGGPGDGTGLLWGLLDLGARDAALAVMADPEAVSRAIEAGVGAAVTLSIGARRDRRHGYPIDIRGRVVRIGPGRVQREGPLEAGATVDLGRSVVIQAEGRHGGDVAIIVTDQPAEVDDVAFFRAHDIDPAAKRILAVKSSLRYRAGFAAIAAELIAVATPGVTVPDFAYFPYQRLRRPIFPIDPSSAA
ncbi:MAG: M81 family metallopeptidase [Sphaerobacter sp.]|nr:M81 family metallopeptidase [Sphaerobacter sp.]